MNSFKPDRKSNKPGYAFLLILIPLAVIVCIYAYQSFSIKLLPENPQDPEYRPWKDEKLIVDKNRPLKNPPKDNQVKLNENLRYSIKVTEGKKERGEITLFLSKEGKITGSWSAEFRHTEDIHNQVIACTFSGNVDSSKIYKPMNEPENPEKLFMITEGNFNILETHDDSGRVKNASGDIYLTGWIKPDLYAQGKLYLTADKKHSRIYKWKSTAVEEIENFPTENSNNILNLIK